MGMFRVQLDRAFHSKTLPYVALVSLAVMAICHVQACLAFWGHDVGEVPAASTMWAGNYQSTGAWLVCFYLTYLIFPLSAAIYGDNFFTDVRSHASSYLASRSSLGAYVISGALAAFLVSFVAFLLVFLAAQLMALFAFPLTAGVDAYVTRGVIATSRVGWELIEGMPFQDLYLTNRYLYNLLYCAYDALWAAIMALAAYVTSLYTRKNRIVVIGLPTLAFLTLFLVLPTGVNVVDLLLPTIMGSISQAAFVAAPVLTLLLLGALLALRLRLKRDVLL